MYSEWRADFAAAIAPVAASAMMAPRAFAQPDNPPIRVRGNESRDALGVGRSALGGLLPGTVRHAGDEPAGDDDQSPDRCRTPIPAGGERSRFESAEHQPPVPWRRQFQCRSDHWHSGQRGITKSDAAGNQAEEARRRRIDRRSMRLRVGMPRRKPRGDRAGTRAYSAIPTASSCSCRTALLRRRRGFRERLPSPERRRGRFARLRDWSRCTNLVSDATRWNTFYQEPRVARSSPSRARRSGAGGGWRAIPHVCRRALAAEAAQTPHLVLPASTICA